MGLTIFGKFLTLLLEAEANPSKLKEFHEKYTDLTGEDPGDSEYFQIQPNKWGVEYRIYFDAPGWVPDSLEKLGYHVEVRGQGYRAEYPFRVNSERLFWKLVEHGYRLGPNSPIPAT